MTPDTAPPAPDLGAVLGEEFTQGAPHDSGRWRDCRYCRLVAAVRAVEALAQQWRSTTAPLALQLAGDDLHKALTAAMTSERTTP